MIETIQAYLNRTKLSSVGIGFLFGLLSFLIRIPFLLRYDLHFGGDPAIGHLMELRILDGDRPLYFYGQDYMGALEPYLGSLAMKLFGTSISVAASIGLLQWSIAVGLFLCLFTEATSKFEGFVAGIVTTIGVPYTLTYMTEPFTGNASNILITAIILLLGSKLLTQGGNLLRFELFGFFIGFGYWLNPQSMLASATCLIALFWFKTPQRNIKTSLRPLQIMAWALGLALGALPEIGHRSTPTQNFLTFASPHMIFRNIECVLKCALAYFDAQPISRMSDGIYFWLNVPTRLIPAQGLGDDLFLLLGAGVLIFIGLSWLRALKEKDINLFLFSTLVLINLFAMLLSAKTNADTVNGRRYLTCSAILFSLWTAHFFVVGLRTHSKNIQIAVLCLTGLFLGRVLYHDYQLLQTPDQLREMRWVLEEMKADSLDHGLADWPFSAILTSLSGQQVIVAQSNDRIKIPDYQKEVAATNRIAVIQTNENKTEKTIEFEGSKYQLDGPVQRNDTFWLAAYKAKKGTP